MCGRVTLTLPDVDEVARLLEAHVTPENAALYRPRFNAAPTDVHFVVTPGRELVPVKWGVAGPGGLLINARAESVATQRTFRAAWEAGRVVVPADGFYEWKGPRGARRPVWFRPREGRLLHLAGLVVPQPGGAPGFVVLTTAANGMVSRVHDRMPVLLPRERIGDWLARPDGALLVPAPDDFLTATEVSSRVNDVRNDDASVLQPDALPAREQLSLFGGD